MLAYVRTYTNACVRVRVLARLCDGEDIISLSDFTSELVLCLSIGFSMSMCDILYIIDVNECSVCKHLLCSAFACASKDCVGTNCVNMRLSDACRL